MLNKFEQKFLDKLARNSSGCWEWTKCRDKHGYGESCMNGRRIFAHRAAFILFCGPIPDGMCVLHKCDNPSCCRPDHLILGTPKDNMRDMASKNRAQNGFTKGTVSILKYSGENCSNAKLTEKQVIEMRKEFDAGVRLTDLSKKYGIALSTTHAIVHRRNWTHV